MCCDGFIQSNPMFGHFTHSQPVMMPFLPGPKWWAGKPINNRAALQMR